MFQAIDRPESVSSPTVRTVSFCRWHLQWSEPEANAYIRDHKPAGVPAKECLFLPDRDAPARNRCLAQTRAAVGDAALPWRQAIDAFALRRDSEIVPQWSDAPWDDCYARDRAADKAFVDAVPEVAEAADFLARHAEAGTFLAHRVGAKVVAEMRINAGVSLAPTGDPFPIGPALAHLFRSFGRFAQEAASAPHAGMMHPYRLGPFLFPEPLDLPHATARMGIAVLFGAVYAARVATGCAATSGRVRGCPRTVGRFTRSPRRSSPT